MKDFLIIGGGPSAAIAAEHLCRHSEVCLVSEQLGGVMSVMGERKLQSFCDELELPNSKRPIQEFMSSLALSPTANEYTSYVSSYISSLPLETCIGKVEFFGRNGDFFESLISTKAGKITIRSRNIILATGLRARATPRALANSNALNCLQAYQFLHKGNPSLAHYSRAAIFGSGNSAYQLAESAYASGLETSIFAQQYLGIFPQETTDRFSLRAPTQPTIEKIWKSQKSFSKLPLNFYIYSSLTDRGGSLCLYLQESEANTMGLFKQDTQTKPTARAITELEIVKRGTLFITAIGTQGRLPENNIPDLLKLNKDGFVDNEKGKTSIPGLYVIGALAGARSVNTMELMEC